MVSRDKARKPQSWSVSATGSYEDAVIRHPGLIEHLRGLDGCGALEAIRVLKPRHSTEVVLCSGGYITRDGEGNLVERNVSHAAVLYLNDGQVKVYRTIEGEAPFMNGVKKRPTSDQSDFEVDTYSSRTRFALDAPHLASQRTLRARIIRVLGAYDSLDEFS
jgi:hypothetical protein